MKAAICFSVFLLLLAGCRRNETVNHNALKHVSSIAILPAEVIMTGKQPGKLKPEHITVIEETESRLLQGQIQESVVNATMGKKRRTVRVIDMDKINNQIISAGSSIRQSWTADTETLGRLVGADAVIRTRITKTRYMSNVASYGTSLGADVLDILKRFYIPGALSRSNMAGSGVMQKTHSIDLNIRLISSENGSVLWSYSEVFDADWNTPVEKSIAGSLEKMMTRFPSFR